MVRSVEKQREEAFLNKVNEFLLKAIVGSSVAYVVTLIFYTVR